MLREGIPVFNNISSILVKTLVAFSIYSLLQGLVWGVCKGWVLYWAVVIPELGWYIIQDGLRWQ